MYLALYRRFRPETFDRVLGQEHIVRILTNQIKSDTTGHAYLFCGTRGTGKTTMARLLAKGVNCVSDGDRPCGACENCRAIQGGVFMDVIEIDAASNNGVDNIRELKESVIYPPSVGRRKVYIVDEVHMLTPQAFNALLKTLEEPPANVMFVLATTEPRRLPATILSRCLRLDFKRVPAELIARGMARVCEEIGADVSREALALLANAADGSVRDGLSLLDQCVCAGEAAVTRDTVLTLLGSPGEAALTELTDRVHAGDVAGAIRILAAELAAGKDERQILKDWIEHFRNLMLLRHIENPQDILNLSDESIERLRAQSERFTSGYVNESIFELARILNDANRSTRPRILIEAGLVAMAARAAAPEHPSAHAKPARETTVHRESAIGDERMGERAKPAPVEPAPEAHETPDASNTVARADAPENIRAEATNLDLAVEAPVHRESAIGDEHMNEHAKPAPAAALDWPAVIAKAAERAEKKMLLLRLDGRSRLVSAADGRITVAVFDEMTKKAADEHRDLLTAAAEHLTGRPWRLECRPEKRDGADARGERGERKAEDPASAAREIAERFNIEVELE